MKYKDSDFEIKTNEIVRKEYTGTMLRGHAGAEIPHYNWETVLKVIDPRADRRALMPDLLRTVQNHYRGKDIRFRTY